MKNTIKWITLNKQDLIHAARYLVTFFMLIIVFQKMFNPAQYKSFTEFIAFVYNLDVNISASVLNPLYYGIVIFEIAVIAGLFQARFFNYAIYIAIMIICLEFTASLFSAIQGLKSTCSYGLFGENPYLLLLQQTTLLILILIVGSLKHHYFAASRDIC